MRRDSIQRQLPPRRTVLRHTVLRRTLAWLALPALVLGLLLLEPEPSWAASGGRIGGGSFRSAP